MRQKVLSPYSLIPKDYPNSSLDWSTFSCGRLYSRRACRRLANSVHRGRRCQKVFHVLGIYGMPLFFVLSGFVIHYNYRRLFLSRSIARATCEFAAARFARLFPLYFCLLFVAFTADHLIEKAYGIPTLIIKVVAYYLTLTQSWWYVVYDHKLLLNWIFGLSWSISTEMFFYATFVAVVFLILLIRRARTAALVAVGYEIIAWCCFALVAIYFMPISRFFEFVSRTTLV